MVNGEDFALRLCHAIVASMVTVAKVKLTCICE